jgi:hypothetical protein
VVPGNVAFHQQDLREDFGEEWYRKFDVVCVRLVIVGMGGDDWGRAMKALIKLLSWVPFPSHLPSCFLGLASDSELEDKFKRNEASITDSF